MREEGGGWARVGDGRRGGRKMLEHSGLLEGYEEARTE